MKTNKSFPVRSRDFHKSTMSSARYCVEVARKPQGVAVRDSKDPTKKVLFFTHREWEAFIGGVKLGEFEV